MISFRNINKSDYREVCSFFSNKRELNYTFPKTSYPFDARQLQNIISTRSEATMLLLNEIPAGFADLYNITNGKECFIGNFVISKHCRKMGLSKVLLEEMIHKGITLYNVQKICIHCWCENTAALLLYEKFCFKPVEIVVREFDKEKIPVLLLEKSINPE